MIKPVVTDHGICTSINAASDVYSKQHSFNQIFAKVVNLDKYEGVKVKKNTGSGKTFQMELLLDIGQERLFVFDKAKHFAISLNSQYDFMDLSFANVEAKIGSWIDQPSNHF